MSIIDGAVKKLEAHVWEREANEHYVEPAWCSKRLLEEENFWPGIWDPCCGFGTIPKEAAKQELSAIGTDIIDRGYEGLGSIGDFMKSEGTFAANIVCNPPFNIAKDFALKALSLDVEHVAMIFPTARLNAAHWLHGTPLARVWLMTPRPSMPPGHVVTAGGKITGGKMDYCWLVWEVGHKGEAEIRWLRRDAAPSSNKLLTVNASDPHV